MEILFMNFLLIFARFLGAFFMFPVFSSRNVNNIVKILLVISVSALVSPFIKPYINAKNFEDVNFSLYFILMLKEILIGIILSISTRIYFYSINIVGQIISMQSGLSYGTLFDPNQNSQVSLLSGFLTMVLTMFILATDTHYLFIKSIIFSYEKFPISQMPFSGDVANMVSFTVSNSFLVAFKIASPFMIISLAIMVGGGVLSRLMPSFQVFFVITPAQIIVLLIILLIVLESIFRHMIKVIIDNMSYLLT